MVSGQGIKKGPAMAHAVTRESRYFRLASNIIDPISPTRLKSLINRDTKKDVCTWRDPLLGLNLLQIAVIADNVRAGAVYVPPSTPRASAQRARDGCSELPRVLCASRQH